MPPIAMTTTNLSEEASKLLDFTQKLDINLLDSVVSLMYASDGQNGQQVCIKLVIWILLVYMVRTNLKRPGISEVGPKKP